MTRGTPLTPGDYQALESRWIDRELADAAALRRVDDREGGEVLGRNGSGSYSGIVIPYFLAGADHPCTYRVRRDHCEMEAGRPKGKYLAPPGENRLYFAPGTDPAWLSEIRLAVVITEGEFKTLALSRLARHQLSDASELPRFLPVGLGGCWNWKGKAGKTVDAAGARVDDKAPIPDLSLITWKGRTVVIIFDRDLENNESVRAAHALLTSELQKRGAAVSWFQWPADAVQAKGIDDLLAAIGPEKVLHLIDNALPARVKASHQQLSAREFTALADDRYRLAVPGVGVTFEIDRLRREHQELIGELAVRCQLPGARSVNGDLSIADFNLSSARARSERAKLLADRANTKDLDWFRLLEEFCQLVLRADRNGQPAVDLRDVPLPEADDDILIEGFAFPRRHPTIIFGDGGASKSYTGLYLAGRMAQCGTKVALFDWELAAEDHRCRLQLLFGAQMPRIMYARCERPLVFDVDRLRRIVREHQIEFSIFDSVAFACDGPPEAAEVAGRYFRAVRQIGGGSLHVAHITKGEHADRKPFGSTFWHNGARSTWYAEKAEESGDSQVLHLGFFHRKANLGRLHPDVGYCITFEDDRTTFRRENVAETPDLAAKLTVRQRMIFLLSRGAMTVESIAEEIDAKPETVTRTANRNNKIFTVLDGGRLALLERNAS